jgi:hypothetical protein
MGLVAVALFLLAAFWSVYRHPANAVSLTFTLYAFEQFAQAHVPFFVEHSWFLNILFAGMVGLAFVQRGLRGERIATGISHGTLLLASLYAMHPFSAIWTPKPELTLDLFVHSLPYIFLLTFLTPLVIDGPNDLQLALRNLWFTGAIVLVLVLFGTEFASNDRGVALKHLDGLKETTGNPLAVAGLGGAVAIIALVMTPLKGSFGRFICVLTAMLGLYAAARTGSRGQFFGTAAVLGLAFIVQALMSRIRILSAVAFIGAGVVAVLWMIHAASEFHGDRFAIERMEDAYLLARVRPATIMIEAWANGGPWAWAFGLGGSASYHYVGYYPHMVPVEVLTELGIVGFSMYIGFALVAIMRLRWLIGEVSDELKDVAICAGALFAFETMMSLKQGALLGCDYMMCHGLIICGVAQVWAYRMPTPEAKSLKPRVVSDRNQALESAGVIAPGTAGGL